MGLGNPQRQTYSKLDGTSNPNTGHNWTIFFFKLSDFRLTYFQHPLSTVGALTILMLFINLDHTNITTITSITGYLMGSKNRLTFLLIHETITINCNCTTISFLSCANITRYHSSTVHPALRINYSLTGCFFCRRASYPKITFSTSLPPQWIIM